MMTEERMAAYLNDLHISSDDHSSSSDSLWSMSGEDDSVSSYTVNMSQWDLERKLRNAQKITICDEVLGLNKTVVLFGLAAGAMVIAAVFATMPSAGRLEAHERATHHACHMEEVSLDEGYGVSRVAERRVCDAL